MSGNAGGSAGQRWERAHTQLVAVVAGWVEEETEGGGDLLSLFQAKA